MTAHYLGEAARLARRLAVVDQGRIVAEGAPGELKADLREDAVVVELEEQPGDGEVARAALAANGDWSIVFSRMGYLAIFTVVCTWLATRAFRVYQRSI